MALVVQPSPEQFYRRDEDFACSRGVLALTREELLEASAPIEDAVRTMVGRDPESAAMGAAPETVN